jgi:hypothetical protein
MALSLTRVLPWLFIALAISGGGCASRKQEKALDFKPVLARLFIEAGGDIAGIPMQLPASGTQVLVNPKPVFGEFDILAAEIVRVDLGLCVYLQLNGDAARDFYRFSLVNRGRRMLLALNGAPVGASLIDRPVSNGALFFFVELPDGELPELVYNINRTSQEMAKEAAKARKS